MLLPLTATLWLRSQKTLDQATLDRFRGVFPKTPEGVDQDTLAIVAAHVHELASHTVLRRIHRRIRSIVKKHGHKILHAYWWPVISGTAFLILHIRRKEGPIVEVGLVWKSTKDKQPLASIGGTSWHGGGHLPDKRRVECEAPSYKTVKFLFIDWCRTSFRPPQF